MIEKLKAYEETPSGYKHPENRVQDKINELVDAVNVLQCKNVHIESNLQDLMYPKEIKCEAENVQDEMPKCPFCGEELSYAQEIDGGFEILTCDCPHGIWLFGNDKMWYNLEKTTTDLERTRKALDVAVDALREIHLPKQWCPVFAEQEIAKKALDEITALEQKD